MQEETNQQPGARPRSEEIAWAAGLFEGEGCFNAFTRGNKMSMQVRLGSTDLDVVERFAGIIGCGKIHRPRIGKGDRAHHKPFYEWTVYEAKLVREVAAVLGPWLGERRRARMLEVLEAGKHIQEHFGKRTHCPQGHPLSGENLVYEKGAGGKQIRRCKICRRIQSREKMRRQRGITPDRYRV